MVTASRSRGGLDSSSCCHTPWPSCPQFLFGFTLKLFLYSHQSSPSLQLSHCGTGHCPLLPAYCGNVLTSLLLLLALSIAGRVILWKHARPSYFSAQNLSQPLQLSQSKARVLPVAFVPSPVPTAPSLRATTLPVHRSSHVSHKHQPLSLCIYSSLPRLILPQMSTQYSSSPSVLPSGVTSVRPSPITFLLGGWDFGLFCSLPCPQSLEQSLPILGA